MQFGFGFGFLFVCILSISLLSGTPDAPGSSWLLLSSALESAISPRSPQSFHWRTVLETEMGAFGVLVATGALFVLSHLS